jgi:orotidine-5'-phosphate decarboxylase
VEVFCLFTGENLCYNEKNTRKGEIIMSVDVLQEKIRKTKNPTMLELYPDFSELPPRFSPTAEGVCAWFRELLAALKDTLSAVRVSFGGFALLGSSGMDALAEVLSFAKKQGYYVLLDAPELLSVRSAAFAAQTLLGKDSPFACDGLIIGGYPGSDVIKPFLDFCREGKKDIFVVSRTANKSAPELQDLLSGGRLVHVAAADHVNRYGADTAGKFGYTRVGILAAASAASSLKDLRSKYPKLFMILDGADYPNANAKNCANAFDKFGHGAVAVVGSSVTAAWKQEGAENDLEAAVAAANRMKKNLNRYITIL